MVRAVLKNCSPTIGSGARATIGNPPHVSHHLYHYRALPREEKHHLFHRSECQASAIHGHGTFSPYCSGHQVFLIGGGKPNHPLPLNPPLYLETWQTGGIGNLLTSFRMDSANELKCLSPMDCYRSNPLFFCKYN